MKGTLIGGLLPAPHWGWGPKPGHMPWWGIEPVALVRRPVLRPPSLPARVLHVYLFEEQRDSAAAPFCYVPTNSAPVASTCSLVLAAVFVVAVLVGEGASLWLGL